MDKYIEDNFFIKNGFDDVLSSKKSEEPKKKYFFPSSIDDTDPEISPENYEPNVSHINKGGSSNDAYNDFFRNQLSQ